MATYLTRTQAAGTSRKIFTVSMWIKKTTNSPGHEQYIFHSWNDGNNRFMVALQNDDTLQIRERASASTSLQIDTNRKFRDTNAWYHIVVRVDTTQSTAADRIRIYINGEQETSFSTASYPSQDLDLQIGTSSYTFYLAEYGGGGNNFNGLASHWNFADGQSLAPTEFGETDSTTGEWKINTSPSVTYGTNGFFILKDGNSVTDQSGNSNNFAVASGTLTKTEDNPSNVFATLNPLAFRTAYTLSNGNNYFNGGTITSWVHGVPATIGASSGKYYWEVKWKNGTSVSIVGVLPIDKAYHCSDTGGGAVYNYSNGWQLSNSGAGDKYNYVASNGSGFQRAHDDVIMFAMDMDNKKLWSGANGTWYSSGNPATGANPTWDTSEFPSDWDNGFIPYCQSYYSGTVTEFAFNFGNGYFGSTQISSAGTNASGIGIFEYDVPTGFTALSTKGLNL